LGVPVSIVVVGLNQNSTLNGPPKLVRAAAGDADQVVDAVEAEGLADEAGGVAGPFSALGRRWRRRGRARCRRRATS
jgi:hypothetical protein